MLDGSIFCSNLCHRRLESYAFLKSINAAKVHNPNFCLVSAIVAMFRICSMVPLPTLKPHCSSTKISLSSSYSTKNWFRILAKIWDRESKDIPLYTKGSLGSLIGLLGMGTIVAFLQAVGMSRLFLIEENKLVKNLMQILFLKTSTIRTCSFSTFLVKDSLILYVFTNVNFQTLKL